MRTKTTPNTDTFTQFNLNPKRLTFQTIQIKCISNLVKNCDINKSFGIDRLVDSSKMVADILTVPITQVCNLSVKISHFPKDCKVAKLNPMYKTGTKTDSKKYRPISLYPIVSKIIEKVMHDQTVNYLTENNILCGYQSGFAEQINGLVSI